MAGRRSTVRPAAAFAALIAGIATAALALTAAAAPASGAGGPSLSTEAFPTGETPGAPPVRFEPRADPDAVVGQAAVVALCGGVAAYWWLSVVPAERRALGREKRRGALNEYLKAIAADESRAAERWFYADWLRKNYVKGTAAARPPPSDPEAVIEATTIETPAEDVDSQPAFWSLDNPLVATALLLLGATSVAALARLLSTLA